MEGRFVFVNGALYTGLRIYDVYKGLGWPGGRPISIEMPREVPTEAAVFFVDIEYGKLRQCLCEGASRFGPGNQWRLVTQEGDSV